MATPNGRLIIAQTSSGSQPDCVALNQGGAGIDCALHLHEAESSRADAMRCDRAIRPKLSASGIDKPNDLALTHTKDNASRWQWQEQSGIVRLLRVSASLSLSLAKHASFAIVISVKVSGDAFAR